MLTGKQKKYLKKNLRKLSPSKIARKLGVSEEIIREYLKKKWKGKKYQKFQSLHLSLNRKSLVSRITKFNFKDWLKKNRFQLLIIAFLTFVVYANGISNEFVSDDVAGILQNPAIGQLDHVFANPPGIMQPLIFFIIHEVFGKIPAAFRTVNIFFHLANCLLVYLSVSLLVNRSAAFFGAALAAVHPLMVESVTWISGGIYAQYSFFLLLGLVFYLFSLKDKRFYCLTILAFIVGLISSEKAMVFPFILLALHLSYPKDFKGWQKLIIPFLIGFTWISFYVGKVPERISILKNVHYEQAQTINPLLQIPIAIGSYLQMTFWPTGLTLYHTELHFSVPVFVSKVLVLLVYLFFLGYSFFRKKKYFFWLSLFGIALSPTLTPFGISWIIAERYAYLGLFGIFVSLGLLLARLGRRKDRKMIIAILFALIIFGFSARTIVRNIDWKNQDNLWIAAAKTSPSSSQNHNNLGDMYARHNDLDKAIEEFEIAIKLKPGYADAYHNLANIYLRKEEMDKAIAGYEKALELNPNIWQSHQNLAAIYFNQNNPEEAEKHLRAALEINPKETSLYPDLAIILFRKGQKQASLDLLNQALQIDPDNQKARDLFIQIKQTN